MYPVASLFRVHVVGHISQGFRARSLADARYFLLLYGSVIDWRNANGNVRKASNEQ